MSIVIHPTAQNDIEVASEDILEDLSAGSARLFQMRLDATLESLHRYPLSIARYEPAYPRFPELRITPVNRFNGRLICYQPIPGGILVLRILQASRDLDPLFG